jgi:hypothetical protein
MTRITTTVPGLFSVLLVGFLTVNVFAADPEPPTLGKSFHSDAIRFVAAISEDQQASTLIFDNFVVATAQGKGQLLSAETKSFTLGNQIEAKDAVTVTMDLRGFVATQDGGTAAVIVHAGQETTVVDLPRAIAAATSKPRKTDDPLYVQAQTDAERAGFDDRAPSKKSNDFSTRITVTLEKGQPLQATVVLLTDRQPNADSSALVVVDSIDVSVKAAPAPKKTEQKSASPKLTLVSGEKETAETKSAEKKPAEKKTAAKKATEKKDAGDSMTSKPADAPKSAPKDTESKASPKKAVKEKSDSKAEEKKAADTKKSGA